MKKPNKMLLGFDILNETMINDADVDAPDSFL